MGTSAIGKQELRYRWGGGWEQGFQTMTCPGGDTGSYKGCEAKGPAGQGEGGLIGKEAAAW